MISSFPDFDDMTRAILEVEDAIVLLGKKSIANPKWLPESTQYVYKYSLKGLWYFLTSSKIYYTHGLYLGFSKLSEKRQLVINLWHGMPLKRVGLLDGKVDVPDFHYVYCSSEFFAPIISKVFGVTREQLIIDILPRNKILLRQSDNVNLNLLVSQYNKILVWLPTYRKSNVGDIRIDGSANNNTVFGFEGLDVERLNSILQAKNYKLIVKPHPMAVVDDHSFDLSNISIIGEEWLQDSGVTLYELLSVSNELWTDFSSVFVDYELTQKDILFTMSDLESMKSGRGLNFDINEYKLPGVIVQNSEMLLDYVSRNSLRS